MKILKSLKKIKLICDLYINAPSLSQEGVEVYSVDEMTSIQALERKYPDKPMRENSPELNEFEYIRHGTTSLIAFLNVADGAVDEPYLNQTRTEEDFCQAIKNLLDQDTAKEYVFICDGLNIHKSESLVKLVAQKCQVDIELRIKGKKGILKNMASREQFLMDNSHSIRFVYTPKHSSWVNQIEIWFSILSRRLLKRSSYTSTEDLKQSILKFIKQYNIAPKPFKWKYSGLV